MADKKRSQESAEETNARFSQPITTPPQDDWDARTRPSLRGQVSEAPREGAEGSNFSGGQEGQEESPLAGREDYNVANDDKSSDSKKNSTKSSK